MTQEQLNERFEAYKENHLKFIEDTLMNEGELEPTIGVMGYNKEDIDKLCSYIAPLGPEFSENKDEILDMAVSLLFEEAKENGFTPHCFTFAFEGYMTKIPLEDLKDGQVPEDWKTRERMSVLMVNFETKDKNFSYVYETEKVGKAINSKGEMIDQLKMTPLNLGDGETSKMGGRFANLFNKYS